MLYRRLPVEKKTKSLVRCDEKSRFLVVLVLTLVVKAVDAIDGGTLMIAAQQKEILGIFDFVREQQADCLERLLAAIDVVAEKQVVRLGRESTVLEQPQQIVVLTVDIA